MNNGLVRLSKEAITSRETIDMVAFRPFMLFALGGGILFFCLAMEYKKSRSLFLSCISFIPFLITNILLFIAVPWVTLSYVMVSLLYQTAIIFLYNTTIIIHSGLDDKETYLFFLPGTIYGVLILMLFQSFSQGSGFIGPMYEFGIVAMDLLIIVYAVIAGIHNISVLAERKNK